MSVTEKIKSKQKTDLFGYKSVFFRLNNADDKAKLENLLDVHAEIRVLDEIKS